MRKDEFLQTLRRALNGNVPPRVVEENVRYYDGYISDEVRKGRSEEEVIEEIGDPRLIARTIEDTTDGAGEGEFVDDDASAYSRSSDRGYGTYDSDRTGSTQRHSMHYIDLSKWVLAYIGGGNRSCSYLSGVYGGRRSAYIDRSAHRTAVSYLADCNNFPEF